MIESSPAHELARDARLAIEETLLGLVDLTATFDREGVRDRLVGAIGHTYAVLDSGPLARAHVDGLAEAEARVREVLSMLRAAVDANAAGMGAARDRLAVAAAALREGHEAVAAIQLARRAELYGAEAREAPAPRAFRASEGVPELHAFARRSLVPEVAVGGAPTLPRSPSAPAFARPASFADLADLAARAASGAIAAEAFGRADAEAPPTDPATPAELPLPFEPACAEVEVLRRLARSLLEDIAGARGQRVQSPIETWIDPGRFEARLLASLDAIASLGAAALPVVSLFHAEARAPDPGRAFAAAITLGCVEGHDTVGAAMMMLKQSAPEEHPGWLDGLSLAPSPAVDAALAELARGTRAPLVVLALDALHARGATPDDVVRRLAWRTEPAIAVRVARAIATSLGPAEATARLERLCEATDHEGVRLAAIEALLRCGHLPALDRLRGIADGPPEAEAVRGALLLLCLVGGRSDLDRLITAARRAPTPDLARGVGRFGHPGAIDALLGLVGRADAPVALAAAEALARLTGAGPRETVDEPWSIDLPFEADAPVRVTRPTRRVTRAAADVAGWREALARLRLDAMPAQKLRGGVPFVPLAIVAELEAPETPPAGREEALRELGLVTGLASSLRTRDWVARQRREIVALRALVGAAVAAPGAFFPEARRPPSHVVARAAIALATEEASPAAFAAGSLPFRDPDAPSLAQEGVDAASDTAETAAIPRGPALPFVAPPATARPAAARASVRPLAPARGKSARSAPADVAAFLDQILAPAEDHDAERDAPEGDVTTEELAPGRRRRLVRFDPATGVALADPVWEDLPDDDPDGRR